MTSWAELDKQRVIQQVNKNVQKSLGNLTTYSVGVVQYETNRIMDSIKQQGLISNYDVNINPATMEIEIKANLVQSLNTMQMTFDMAADGISDVVASIIGSYDAS